MINVYTLKNGLRVVMETIPFVRSVSFGIWVRSGSRGEDAATNGLSHFIEHMMFKGTERRCAAGIAAEMDAVGGQLNAYTSKDHTCFFARTLDTHFDVALDVLSDMFFHSVFDPAEMEKERSVILEEINMNEDTPEDLAHDILQGGVWPGDPLGFPVLGTPETVGGFTGPDFRAFLRRRYAPANTVLAVAGNIRESETLAKMEAVFGGFAADETFAEPKLSAIYAPAFVSREKDIEQTHLCMGFPGIPVGSDGTYAMAIFNTLFGGGMSSRLFQTIREERGLAYSVYSCHNAFADTGLFAVYAALAPPQTQEVLDLIRQECRRFFTDRVSAGQLANTKEQIKSSFLMSLESSSNRMNSIGRTLLLLNKTVTAEELIMKIDAVTLDRLYALCEQVLVPERMSLALVGRGAEAALERARA